MMMSGSPSERGSIALMLALSLTVLMAAGALVIDLGHARVVAAELQAGLDAAAVAGASKLRDGPDVARAAAQTIAFANRAGGAPIEVAEADIEIGTWDLETNTFTVLYGDDEALGDSVRVVVSEQSVPVFLAEVMGVDRMSIAREATAGSSGSDPVTCGIVAMGDAKVTGSLFVDGYNGDDGPYSSLSTVDDAGICSNADLEIAGHARVEGSVFSGPDAAMVSISGAAVVTGTIDQLESDIVMPAVDASTAALHNDNASIGKTSKGKSPLDGQKFDMQNGSLTLNSGTYYFTEFNLNGSAVLTVSGAVSIYVKGDVHINGGGIVNGGHDPADLTILIDGSHSFEVNGNADFYGSIIAPKSEGHVNGNSDFYGIIVSDGLELNGNGDIHIDTSLAQDLGMVVEQSRSVVIRR